ncbi:hypothetical protein [Sphingomonas sp. Y38-1Y]|uniref:hypothetical protein n=1 Tax=Sphingomonas sp. Y38-1Y TaxID=3078265 RepID=UPI0028E996B5|nr:hypothetical protein [Sphingomonas sp. Y38-1Y]
MLVKVLVGAAALAMVQGPPSPTFCERMAPTIDMIAVERGRQGNATGEWRRDTATLGMALVGGIAATSISIRPISETTTYAEATALVDKACATTKAGVRCRFEGPVRLKMGTRKGEIDMAAQPGERAEVEIRGTKIFCRDPRAFKDA